MSTTKNSKLKPKFKQGDEVIVRAGKDKGRTGKVLSFVSPKGYRNGLRVLIEGINLVKKHMKPTQTKQGGIVEKEAPLDLSNIAILNPATQKADKIGVKYLEDGQKVRVFKSNGELIDDQKK